MYLINNKEAKEYISNSVNELLGNFINSCYSIPSLSSLTLMQDICRNHINYSIYPYTYWVIKEKDKRDNDILPNIAILYDRLVLLNNIDSAIDISKKLGICIHHQE